MGCQWSNINLRQNEDYRYQAWLEGKVIGCEAGELKLSYPDYPGSDKFTTVNEDGTFSFELKLEAILPDICKPENDEQEIRIRLECLGNDDPSCVWESPLPVDCGCKIPTIEVAPLGLDYMSRDTFVAFRNLQGPNGEPAPGCNLNGAYKLRLKPEGMDAEIRWEETIFGGNNGQPIEIEGTVDQTEITYQLNVSNGSIVTVVAIIQPRDGGDVECPQTVLTIPFIGCGCPDCSAFGWYDSDTECECQRCPEGQVWNEELGQCQEVPPDPGPADPGTEPNDPDLDPTDPDVDSPIIRFCKCKEWWCYLLGILLSLAVGAFIYGASVCFEDMNELPLILRMISNGGDVVHFLSIGLLIIPFWRLCGSCCTFCFLILGLIMAVVGIIIHAIYTGSIPPCLFNFAGITFRPAVNLDGISGLVAFAAILVIAFMYNGECDE